MDLSTLDLKSALLVLLGLGTVTVLMAAPVRFVQELVSTIWGRLLGTKNGNGNGNGLTARIVSLGQWRDRTQGLFDNGHWVTHEECKRTHRAEENR
jgi:hypothetical protein